MIDDTELRKQVRVILATRPEDQTMPEAWIHAALERFFGTGSVKAASLAHALAWNKARGWIALRYNDDEERDEWQLSDRGRVKEGL